MKNLIFGLTMVAIVMAACKSYKSTAKTSSNNTEAISQTDPEL